MELIKTILVVGAGSFFGCAGRYLVSLAVNLVGCLLIGLLWGFVGYAPFSVVVGIALVALGYFLVR